MIYQSKFNGKCYAGGTNGVTSSQVYPDFSTLQQVKENNIYVIFDLKPEYKTPVSNEKKQQVIHR